jgi:O-6-methylguanine DNA methyltransferase
VECLEARRHAALACRERQSEIRQPQGAGTLIVRRMTRHATAPAPTRYASSLEASFGRITLRARRDPAGAPVLTGLFFSNDRRADDPSLVRDDALLAPIRRELEEYLAGRRSELSFAIDLDEGTPFQREVWRTLARIPYGETWSYAQLARSIGRPTAVRAVGAANGRNPLAIVLPCHRVIGADGRLVGFGGGLPLKEHLLALEARGAAAAKAGRV